MMIIKRLNKDRVTRLRVTLLRKEDISLRVGVNNFLCIKLSIKNDFNYPL